MISLLNRNILLRLLMIGVAIMPLLPSPALGLMVAFFILRLLKQEERKFMADEISNNYLLLLPVLFYLLYLLGLLWTSNFKYAGLDLQSKIPLLILPAAIGTFRFSTVELQRIKLSFRTGCLLAGAVLFINAVLQYVQTQAHSVFFYTDYSRPLMHPTYLSMFLSMAIIFTLEQLKQSVTKKQILMVLLELTFLSVNMILLSARMAMIAAAVLLLFSFTRSLSLRSLNASQKTGALLFLVLITLFYWGANRFSDRFSQVETTINAADTSSIKQHNSATGRVEIWKESITLLDTYWLTGTGTGDVKDELMASYARNNFTYGLERKLNSHNQFLQTWLTLGIAGLCTVLCLFIVPLWTLQPLHRIDFLMFAIITGLNATTESILEVQKGVLCFAFFYTLILNTSVQKQQT